MGWHFAKRVDFNTGYSFVAPTGRYTAGASNNVGSGYWGNDITSGATLYITKNQGTTANIVTDWEIHGQKTVASAVSGQLSKITPGQTFTDEWGIGQVLPLKKDMSQLAQLGLVAYDQWQVTSNGANYLVRRHSGLGQRGSLLLGSTHLAFRPITFSRRSDPVLSLSTTTSIQPRRVLRDALSCSAARGR